MKISIHCRTCIEDLSIEIYISQNVFYKYNVDSYSTSKKDQCWKFSIINEKREILLLRSKKYINLDEFMWRAIRQNREDPENKWSNSEFRI